MINLKGLKVVVRLRFHGTHLWVLKDTVQFNVLPGIHILLTSQRSDFFFTQKANVVMRLQQFLLVPFAIYTDRIANGTMTHEPLCKFQTKPFS